MKFTIMDPRYEDMNYRRCGKSGLLMSEISLGLWHNFGADADYGNCRSIVEYAFDHGVTCFDLANNYGPPAGSAETTFGKIFKQSLSTHRDEIIVTTKAGHHMWAGPYGEWGSRMTHSQFLRPDMLTPELLAQLKEWNATATGMGMTLAQYALKWVLDHRNVASVIVGASSVEQLKSNLSIASDKL